MASDGPKSGGSGTGGAVKGGGAAGVTGSAKNSITPGFLGGAGGGEKTAGLKGGAGVLGAAEDSAVNADLSQKSDDLDGAREGEEDVDDVNYSGSGREDNSVDKEGSFFSNHKGPIITIIITLATFAATMSTSFINPLVAWKENITSMFGQNSAVINKRSNFMMNRLLRSNYETVSDSAFGSKFKISNSLKSKLRDQGIHYAEGVDGNGKKIKLLLYEDPNGRVIPVVASDNDVGKSSSLQGQDVIIDGKKLHITDTPMTLNEARTKNKNFDTNYNTATITFTGKIAGWFGTMADSLFKRIIGKSARHQMEVEGEVTEEKVEDKILRNASEGGGDTDVQATNTKKETDADGNEVTVAYDSKGKKITVDESGNKMDIDETTSASDRLRVGENDSGTVSRALKDKAKKVAMIGTSAACGFLRAMGAISITVGAIQTVNVINLASKYLELADKIKAGDMDETASIAMNELNKTVNMTAYDADGKSTTVSGTVMESEGWNSVFSQENFVDENSPSALMVNRENATRVALRNLTSSGLAASVISSIAAFGGGMTAFSICNGLQAAMGAIDLIGDIVGLFSGGIGKVVETVVMGAIKGLALSAIMTGINAIVTLITPMVASWLGTHLLGYFLGRIGGDALLSGAQNIFNSNLQMSTGKYASKENVQEMYALTKEVEKEWAEYDRATKSPFDITSQYTFLGSIANSLMPIINKSSSSILTPMASIASLAGSKAIAAISPAASAADEFSGISIAGDSNCSYLKAAGVAGDAFCNKYAGAYVDDLTISDPENIYQRISDNFDGEDEYGNPKVKKNSEYAKYIVACVANDSQPGTMSSVVQGFIEKVEKKVTGDTLAGMSLLSIGSNFIPFEGVFDIWDSGEKAAQMKWNTGLACTGNSGDPDFDSRARDYSMYNLDQRVLNEMGLLESNSTVSFLDEYYEENPIDYSYEGTIARFSGMTKEEVSDTLAVIEYFDYIANYDPTERYAFGQDVKPAGADELRFDNDQKVAYVVLFNTIEFADVRNRSFVV